MVQASLDILVMKSLEIVVIVNNLFEEKNLNSQYDAFRSENVLQEDIEPFSINHSSSYLDFENNLLNTHYPSVFAKSLFLFIIWY